MNRGVNGKTERGIKAAWRWLLLAAAVLLLAGAVNPVYGQQFNSDNWWVLPHGVGSGVATVGQHYSAMYLGWGFWPKWEVDISTTLFEKEDGDETNHFSTSAYVKRLLYENETQTGGLALMAGIGSTPGYMQSGVAEIERDLVSERTKEGLKRARAQGKLLGRPKGSLGKSKLDGYESEIREYLGKGVNVTNIAKIYGVSWNTMRHFIRSRKLD